MAEVILIRGAGDLATGVAVRLYHAGLRIVMTEIAMPLAVRRTVSFSEAIYTQKHTVEEITAQRVEDPTDLLGILSVLAAQKVPVLVDPECTSAALLHPVAIVDARMTKQPPLPIGYSPALYIGLGPGFTAGSNCQAVIETQRGHSLGKVRWRGSAQMDTGVPGGDPRRVLRSPCGGILHPLAEIGSIVTPNQVLATINSQCEVRAPFAGILRGILPAETEVTPGMKIGDVDERQDPMLCQQVSEKALAVAGGVLEALLDKPEVRARLWA